MAVASKEETFLPLFSLGKSKLYELAEVPEEKLKGLTPNSIMKLRTASCAVSGGNNASFAVANPPCLLR